MRSTSMSKRCDMRLRSSSGSSDQSTFAMDDDVSRNEELKKRRTTEA
ncbi:hypothetical protein A2U01_0027010, partial [Trifolium medium]|nr:hypothetical protein [Trifolium medium]